MSAGVDAVTVTEKVAENVPLVSVVTIAKNCVQSLDRTIRSVAGQSFRNHDYAVIDGGSSDTSLDVIKANEKAITVWVSEPDHGIADAFNKGILRTRGKWIIFMNAGDCFVDSGVLAILSETLSKSDSFDIVHGEVRQIDKDGVCVRTVGGPLNRRKFNFHMAIPHQAIFHNRDFFNCCGLFDESYKIAMDYELLTRKKNLRALYVAVPVASTELGGVSQQNYRKLIMEMRKIRGKNIAPNTLLSDGRYFLTYAKISFILLLRKMFGEKFI
jgi:glycosyltransferase involved in cell wall biosynthesis